jgi:YqaJ-like viral recombinase domain
MSVTPTAAQRRSFIGGSDARIIRGTDEAALVRLWREKRGEAEPEDLSGNLVAQLGAATEDLNRSWYERNTGRQVRDVSLDGSDPGRDRGGHGSGRRVVDHHRRGQVGRNHDSHGPTLPQRPRIRGKEILAVCPIRRTSSPHQCRTAATTDRGHSHRRYEFIKLLEGIRGAVPQYPQRFPRP